MLIKCAPQKAFSISEVSFRSRPLYLQRSECTQDSRQESYINDIPNRTSCAKLLVPTLLAVKVKNLQGSPLGDHLETSGLTQI